MLASREKEFLDYKGLTGVEKAAIIMDCLGKKAATKLLEGLTQEEMEPIFAVVDRLPSYSLSLKIKVLEAFYEQVNQRGENDGQYI